MKLFADSPIKTLAPWTGAVIILLVLFQAASPCQGLSKCVHCDGIKGITSLRCQVESCEDGGICVIRKELTKDGLVSLNSRCYPYNKAVEVKPQLKCQQEQTGWSGDCARYLEGQRVRCIDGVDAAVTKEALICVCQEDMCNSLEHMEEEERKGPKLLDDNSLAASWSRINKWAVGAMIIAGLLVGMLLQ